MASFSVKSSIAKVIDLDPVQRLLFGNVYLLIVTVVSFALVATALFRVERAIKGKNSTLEKYFGKAQKKTNRTRKQRSQRSRSHKQETTNYQDAPSSDPDTPTDIEVPMHEPSVATMSVAEGYVCEHADVQAEQVSIESYDAHVVVDEDKTTACAESECETTIGSTCGSDSEQALQSDVDIVVEPPASSTDDDKRCCCGCDFVWGCQACAVYSSSLLLAHRDISIRIAKGPPGLTLPDPSPKEVDDWRPAVGEQVRVVVENEPGSFSKSRRGTKGRVGTIIKDDKSDQPFKVKFDRNTKAWYKETWLVKPQDDDACRDDWQEWLVEQESGNL